MNQLPKIEIVHRQRGKDDPTPYQADIWYEDGSGNYHAVADNPARALALAAEYWHANDRRFLPEDER